MLGKNPFRWFLFVVVTMVVLKLGYNLGHRLVSGRRQPPTEARAGNPKPGQDGQALRGVIIDPADSTTAVADTAVQTR